MLDNDTNQETFGMRVRRLQARLKQIDDYEKKMDTRSLSK